MQTRNQDQASITPALAALAMVLAALLALATLLKAGAMGTCFQGSSPRGVHRAAASEAPFGLTTSDLADMALHD